MAYGIQWLRSLVFNFAMYLAMAVIAVVFLPWALFSARGAYAACHTYCRWVRWSAAWMIGLKTEVRGTPPTGPVLVAAKHQSFLDILMIFGAMPRGRFIMKKELAWAPILGQYAWRIGCIFVDRGKRGQAIIKMMRDVDAGNTTPGQVTIYSQGTRVAPGVRMPYKAGTGVLYQQLGQPCVPVACNVGVFWPRHGVYRKPGTAVVEFLDPIPPGLPKAQFMAQLETAVETRSDALMAEAGFTMPRIDKA
ncbi:lysophospholipid acyltransferase family protein [Oceaniglobus trochenteri]|uniref:lysophospholipid acyltransferase family protein n=1 Tax=Oceaniglobus trochenteri TaxID=2763260 RepID=UPI001CFF6215|nr:lysophospholipid acyltransferase family protein [Oceaniglobus trochenteri]